MNPDENTEPDAQAIEDQQIENDIEAKEEAALEAAEEERQMELELERMEDARMEAAEEERLAELEENNEEQDPDADDPDDD